jgi:putative NIF3 family GTP cyclohydrolase 1 type 2
MDHRMTRRDLALLAGAAVGAHGAAPLTAQQVVDRIREKIGVPWNKDTVDTFKAGDPQTRVTGIATTFMSTLDVLKRAAASGKNLIVTHEPTFYNHFDATKSVAGDRVYQYKRDFIEKNGLVVWRFHDHWHMRKPDAVLHGAARLLGWSQYQDAGNPLIYNLPQTTLGQLAAGIKKSLKARTVRYIGNPDVRFSKVLFVPGAYPSMQASMDNPDYEVYVCGETTEWEGCAYGQDMIAAGLRKGMILAGHEVTEEPGMHECAQWLKTIVSEVPVEWMPSGEPFHPA